MQYETVIGILTYAKYDLFKICAESVLSTTDLSKSKLLIVNNSKDEEYINKVDTFARKHKLPIINFRSNRGTSGAWNTIARTYECKQIAILNDDTRMRPLWQEAMNYALQAPGVGVISLAQGIGQDHWNNFENTIQQKDVNIPYNNTLWDSIYPAGSFLMMKKEVFEDVGGFDEDLWIGLEEVDFSLKAISKGYYNGIVHNKLYYMFCDHYGSGTGYASSPDKTEYPSIPLGSEHFKNKHNFPWPMPPEILQKFKQQMKVNQKKYENVSF